MRSERQIVAADPVVAAAVHPFVMKLDRTRLRGDELEPLQDARGESRVPAHRGPFDSVELPALSQQRRVDRDLAQVVQSSGPPEPIDLRERKLERACKPVDVARNP